MNFGPYTSEEDAIRILDRALDEGINFVDTANVYGGSDNRGRTEEIIGRWFDQGGQRRKRTVLATKVFNPMNDSADGPNDDQGLSAFKIRRHIEGSLQRLKTDRVEIYQMAHIDRTALWDELWSAFDGLIQRGLVDYVGSSNFPGWQLVKAQAAAQRRNSLGVISEQHRYNLLCRLPELELLPAAADLGIGVVSYSPLGGGLLGGKALSPSQGTRTGRERSRRQAERHRTQLESFSSLCREIGEPESVVAIAWTLRHPAVTASVIGPRTEEQLTDAIRGADITLDEQTLVKLDSLFPGPGGESPEAYAW